MHIARAVIAMFPLAACAAAQTAPASKPASGHAEFRDDCESPAVWRVLPSDGVEASLGVCEGAAGKGLRLSFDFKKGAGFVVLRRELPLPLGENYRFAFDVRGEAPNNNLEFKLVGGDDVWWVNRREFEFPSRWTHVEYKRRHFAFAWGPSAGKPLERIDAIEMAIASSSGGRGYVDFDEFAYEPLPPPRPYSATPRVTVSSSAEGARPPAPPAQDGALEWRSNSRDDAPTLTLDFQQHREFGGVVLQWDAVDFAVDYDILTSLDGRTWRIARSVKYGNGGRDDLPIADADASFLRVAVHRINGERGAVLRGLRVMPLEYGASLNGTLSAIARESRRGLYPRYFLDEQAYWTVVGVPDDDHEALINTDGAVEIAKRGPTLEPFLFVDGKLLTWADAETTQSLADGDLPLPSVKRKHGDLSLTIRPIAEGAAGESRVFVAYEIRNTGVAPRDGALFVALRPYQVLPPSQWLNITGGACKLTTIVFNDQLCIAGSSPLGPWQPADTRGVATFDDGDVVEFLDRGVMPPRDGVQTETIAAGAAWRFDFKLAPGETATRVFTVPLHRLAESDPWGMDPDAVAPRLNAVAEQARKFWRDQLDRAGLALPPSAAAIERTFRTTQAYILINADGPAIQPGSRTYERSWIRDGALTSTALLYTGHADRVRAFIDWYAPRQFENGKVPCVVDRRGPDPVPEHDSTGQLIHLLWRYYQFTGDRDTLQRHYERVRSGVDYLQALRTQRLTDEFRDGPPEKHVLYGIVPESISHEGYSAKPMHSYWDGFWTARGLRDAAAIAAELGKRDDAARFASIETDHRKCLADSIALAMKNRAIDFIPGCAELGDFDATSTAIAVDPCDFAPHLPPDALRRTFDRYYEFVLARRDGRIEWNDYTPYELRCVGAFVRLGEPDRAHVLLDFLLRDQRPEGWNHWAEVVGRDAGKARFVGDMPHTWCGSEFLRSLREMLVYEDETQRRLVLGAGVPAHWSREAPGVAVRGWPTLWGVLSYTLRESGDELIYETSGMTNPPGGILLRNASGRPALRVTIDGVESRVTADLSGGCVAAPPGARRVVFALE